MNDIILGGVALVVGYVSGVAVEHHYRKGEVGDVTAMYEKLVADAKADYAVLKARFDKKKIPQ